MGGRRVTADHRAPVPASPYGTTSGGGRRRFRSTLGWTALNAIVPGTGLIAAGRRRMGTAVLVVFLVLVGVLVGLAVGGRQMLARWTVDTTHLAWLTVGIGVVALLWAAVIVIGYRFLLPRGVPRGKQVLGGVVVALLVAAIALPAYFTGRVAGTTRDVIADVFDDNPVSATVEDVPDPFGGKDRINVLLLGGDAGKNRTGTRTDTVIVASLDTRTGDTTLISLPRNLENLPFPDGTELAKLYPDGFWTGDENESLLTSIYDNGPELNPDALGKASDNPGADWLKLGVGEALGLHLDYYVLVNLDGFKKLVNALGGITVNVNYYVPIGGDTSAGILPDGYIAPGPNQHLDGYHALMYARGRYGLTDYDRMARQRCAIKAIVDEADPITLLRKYQDLAETTKNIVRTDIPSSALDDFVDLAFLVKDASIHSLVFDTSVINPAYPDYAKMRKLVDRALDPPAPSSGDADGAPSSSPSSATSSAAEPSEKADSSPVDDVEDACAYDPKQAEEARAEGEPPSRFG
jgi:polyisoprenyl-teichoic acid--peptidoglycan teichoic acid transferase